jgi:hypothetical protein
MNPFTIGIALAIYALIMWIMVAMVLRRGYREYRANRPEKLSETRARVMDRRLDESTGRLYLTFELDTGRQREFEVIEAIYTASRVGQAGVLHLRADRFEDFEHQPEDQGWNEIYDRMVRK